MAGFCDIDPSCVRWPRPDGLLCDPCIDTRRCEHAEYLDEAWQIVTSYLYRKTGCKYPGRCWVERVRPCVEQICPPSFCSCGGCGRYRWLPLFDATCLPIVDVRSVFVGPNPCEPEGWLWTPGDDGFRVEHVNGSPRLVIEKLEGCCGTWPTQDLCYPEGSACTWHIDFITGCDPPRDLLHGAAEMANMIVAECVKRGCKVSGSVISQTFDGVSVSFDPDQPATLGLKILQDYLDDDYPAEDFFLAPPCGVTWHRQGPPRPTCEEEGDCPPACSACNPYVGVAP